VAKHILAWSKSDNYAQTRSAPKFTIEVDDPARWRPTPPAYGDALEPHWPEIRTWVIDSSGQLSAEPHVSFSKQKGSHFYTQALAVQELGQAQTAAEIDTDWYMADDPSDQ